MEPSLISLAVQTDDYTGDHTACMWEVENAEKLKVLEKLCFWEVERGRCLGLTNLSPYVSRLSRQCGILNVSQPYRPPRPVTGIQFNYLKQLNYNSTIQLPKRKLQLSYGLRERDSNSSTEY
jgi:hypothetical protein